VAIIERYSPGNEGRGTSVSKVIGRGALIGASEWLLVVPVSLIAAQFRV
jgi:hypothetical protein